MIMNPPIPRRYRGIRFIGIAAATGTVGVGKTIKAGVDTSKAKPINQSANEMVESASDMLNRQRLICGKALERLGEVKLYVISSTITSFLDIFSKIKNVNFRDSEGLEELRKMHADETDFKEMESMVSFAGSIAGGAVAGTAGGAAVLGGLVAGPAPLVLGLVTGHAAKKNPDKALTNQAEAIQIAANLDTASEQCAAIRRRTYMFYNLLARLDSYFLPWSVAWKI